MRPGSTTSPPIGIVPAPGKLEGADVAQQHSQRHAPVHEKHSEQKGWQVKGTRREQGQAWELWGRHAGDLQWRNAMKLRIGSQSLYSLTRGSRNAENSRLRAAGPHHQSTMVLVKRQQYLPPSVKDSACSNIKLISASSDRSRWQQSRRCGVPRSKLAQIAEANARAGNCWPIQ